MNRARSTSRGQPVVALLLILFGWVSARAMLWEEIAMGPSRLPPVAASQAAVGRTPARPASLPGEGVAAPAGREAVAPQSWSPPLPAPLPRIVVPPAVHPLAPPPPVADVPVRVAASHQLMWLAVLSRVPVPMALLEARPLPSSLAPFPPVGREPVGERRWSADGWLLLRRGAKAGLATGAAPATYGASQAGAVLRYRLAPASRHRPAAYLRASAALDGIGEREAAFGVSARPAASLPVAAAVELRATSRPGATSLRPAAMLVSELPPFDLPLGARGEAYAQAGYVDGANATAFADGQLRVDRVVARLGTSEVRAGGGAWGGAQKGASRLDIGPAASLSLGVGRSASARLAAEWRFRVAGDAAPASGPALTLSAGF